MIRHTMLLLIVLFPLLLGSPLAAQEGPGTVQIAQWAARAEASSEFTNADWSAAQATGAPDVLACEDNVNAWASLEVTDDEALTVWFDEAVVPTQVNIYQTYNSGAIVGIDIIPAQGDFMIPVRDSEDTSSSCPTVFSVDLPDDLPKANGVVIYLDQSRIGDWNEIDAVELVGIRQGEAAESMPSSLESNAYPQFNIVSNDGSSTATSTATNSSDGDNRNSANPFASYSGAWGRSVSCDTGADISDGVELTIVQQRSGSRYTVTAIGLNGFDPVLAVLDAAGQGLCNDDEGAASNYSANLPTTGQVNPSSTTSQITFNNNSPNAFEDVTIVVGGFGAQSGEFLLIVEGMVASGADGTGDPFSLALSPAFLAAGVPPTAYMISVTNAFDPLMALVDGNYNFIEDDDRNFIACDDAGNANLCWGESFGLSGRYVSRTQGRQLPGGSLDAMLSVPVDNSTVGNFINYVMRGNESFGDYVAAFHLGYAPQP